jgi:hypothetical protein
MYVGFSTDYCPFLRDISESEPRNKATYLSHLSLFRAYFMFGNSKNVATTETEKKNSKTMVFASSIRMTAALHYITSNEH